MNTEEKEKNIKNVAAKYFTTLKAIEKKREDLFKELMGKLEEIKIAELKESLTDSKKDA